jgi:hypothetical protein
MMITWLDVAAALSLPAALAIAWGVGTLWERRRNRMRRPMPTVHEQQQRRAWPAQQDEYHPFPYPRERN